MRMRSGEGSTMMKFIVCTFHLLFVRMIKSRRMRWAGLVARMEEGTSEGNIPLGRSRRR